MEKPILGIVAVFLAQLAFVGYSYLEQPLDTASILPIAVLGQPLSDFEPEPDTVVVARRSSGPAPAILVNRKTAAEPVVIAARRSIKPPPRNAGYQTDHLVALQKPVVITYRTEYPATSTVSRESDARDYTASPKPSNEKRSLLSKALPVLKKPYDWLKAIGSKMR